MTALNSIQKARGYVHYRVPNVEDIDHGALEGLEQDDHPQYLNEARGDARYYTETETDALLADKSDTSHIHDDRYYTETELDAGQLDNRYYTEAEVDALLIDDGTTTGNTLYWDGSDWSETSAVTVDPAGAVELKHDGVIVAQTIDGGTSLTDTLGLLIPVSGIDRAAVVFGSSAYESGGVVLGKFGDDLFFDNRAISGTYNLRGTQAAGGSPVSLLVGDPDGSVDLYYAGVKALATTAESVDLFDTNGTNPTLRFRQDDSTETLEIFAGGGAAGTIIRAKPHGSPVELRAQDTAGTERTLLIGDPDGPVNLYYTGSKVAETTVRGLKVEVADFAPHLELVRTNNTVNIGVAYTGSTGVSVYAGQGQSGEFNISDSANMSANDVFRFHPTSGAIFGAPSGGFKGAGTLNAEAVYDDGGSPLTDYVFDAELDGQVDVEKWDDRVPDRVIEKTGEDGEVIETRVEVRRHEPARRFAQRLDDLDPEVYATKWRTRRKLPAFDHGDETVTLSVGQYAQRLLETCEVQAVHIDKLMARIKTLEETVNGPNTPR